MDELAAIRERIDQIDTEICALFAERMAHTNAAARLKQECGLPLVDRARERAKLAGVAAQVPEELGDYAQVLFDLLISISRAQQTLDLAGNSELEGQILQARAHTPELFPRQAFVACQGVEGANSQIAADRLFRHATISYCASFEDVFSAVEEGGCQYGVLPVENSTAGTVNQVYDLMRKHQFYIVRSLRLKVDHNLLAVPGATLEGITDVYSHPQAISQCRDYLASMPQVRVHTCENTAVAAKFVAKGADPHIAALSSRSCAALYGLDALARNVQDSDANYTRFACISKNLEIYPGADRTSLMLVTPNEPGSLYKVLARLYALDINLVKLESRPLPKSDFQFMFYFDLDCPVAAPEFAPVMGSLSDICEEYRYLGSYSEMI